MPIDKSRSIEEIIQEIMDSWEKTGKIGEYTPSSKKEALEMATAIAYNAKKEK